MRDRNEVDPDERASRKELGGGEGRKIVIMIYYVKKNYF